jgi:hypothetical protein
MHPSARIEWLLSILLNGTRVNPIIEALLTDFCARQEIESADQSTAFEQFAAFCVLNAERLDQGDFREALTDAGEEGLAQILQ